MYQVYVYSRHVSATWHQVSISTINTTECYVLVPRTAVSNVRYLGAVLSVHNVYELRLQAGATDQETVDVGLGAKGRRGTSVHAAAVDDADLNHTRTRKVYQCWISETSICHVEISYFR